jgi:Uma2 family endonuclease
MSTVTASESTLVSPGGSGPRPPYYRFNVAQFDEMLRNGTIGAKERVELIDGLVVLKMSKNRPHVLAGKYLLAAVLRILPPGFHVAKEDPLVVSAFDKPGPDLTVVRGHPGDYLDRDVTAADVVLVAEIADSSLAADRTQMMQIYSAGGIPVYWIVNLVDHQVEVYTDPVGRLMRTERTSSPGKVFPW